MKTELQTKPILKAMYAWNTVHAGSFLLHVDSPSDCYKFIFLPGPVDYFLTCEDFEAAIKQGMLEFVEILPDEIYREALSLSCPPKISTLEP